MVISINLDDDRCRILYFDRSLPYMTVKIDKNCNVCARARVRPSRPTGMCETQGYNPVSYTHLDVYKRQNQRTVVHQQQRHLQRPGPGLSQ